MGSKGFKDEEGVLARTNFFAPLQTAKAYDWIRSKDQRLDFRVTKRFKEFFKNYCVKYKESPSDVLMNSFSLFIIISDMPEFLTQDQWKQLEQAMEHFLKD